ncbi:MAG: hypothetical protein LCH35_00130 [Bacteroidetes bacterium]|uniref:hypothetical protein n=1 Tax=Flavobacterium sp. TaxID=239 RepID=UPI002FDA680B|nr:hypothetical protein [Bacteroidota bacterium]
MESNQEVHENNQVVQKNNPIGLENIIKVHVKSNVPKSDIDFGEVAKNVVTKWGDNNWLTLLWLNRDAMLEDVSAYNNILAARQQVGSSRPEITKKINIMDDLIDDHISYIKGYIVDKYKKENAPSYFPQFGIVHKKNKYIIPTDQNNRLSALDLMITAITAHDFQDKEYGLAFWTEIRNKYALLLTDANATDGQVSVKVGDKNVLKDRIKKALNAIIFVIRANYPDTYKSVLRDWGFQKEKY